MKSTSKIEMSKLLIQLDNNPEDVNLMNEIALAYFENVDLKTESEDFQFFKKAYETRKTIKSIHNYAWFLYFEWSELNYGWQRENPDCAKALEIQKEVLNHNPKTYLPYYQLGFMLLEQKKVEESIPFLTTAESKKNRKDISHNLGFAYFLNKEYQKAYSKFKSIDSELDLESTSLYNLAICQLQLDLEDELKDSLEILESTIEKKIHKTIDGYDIAQLYAINGEYQKCYDCVELQGFDMIEFTDWPLISYSVKKINDKVWEEQIDKYLNQKNNLITEFVNGNEEEDGYNAEERAKRIIEIKEEINILTKTKESDVAKPKTNLDELLTPDHCGCLLFGCKTHGNIKNDE